MSTIKREHFYYVDPGIGKKRSGCPYTFFKDGRDVRLYIQPPRGYELVDFKYEPFESDDFYDGKIVAQYKKLPFFIRLRKDPVLLSVTVLCIIGVVGGLYYYFNDSQHDPATEMYPIRNIKTETDVLLDDTTQAQVDTSLAIIDTAMIVVDSSMIADTSMITEGILDTVPETEEIATEEVVVEEIKEETVTVKEEEIAPVKEVVEPKEKVEEITPKPELKAEPTQEAQPTETLTKEQFRQEFWSLIHHKETKMRTYGDLYRKYKDQNFKNKEFFYLYLTILENGYAFDAWKNNLLNIPDDELKSIRTISALTEKLEEYE